MNIKFNDSEIIRALLLELESGCTSSDDVADKLRLLGIQGKLRHPRACPLRNYLVMHGLTDVSVGIADVTDINYNFIEIPKMVSLFRFEFDKGHYPDLVR